MSARPQFFHGWVMLGVAILMALATMPGQTVIVSIFNTPLREKLGLSVTQLSGAYMVGTILAALPLPLVGKLADRFGVRIVTGVVAVLFALSLVLLSQAWSLVALGGAFFLIRFLGQGALGLLAGHTIALWFERKLGSVHAALAVGGFAAGSAVLPYPVAAGIESIGATLMLLALAAMVLLLVLPAVLTVFRNKPEDIGQHLDGDAREHATHDVMHGGEAPEGDPAFTSSQAVRTPAFWILALNMMAAGLIGTALLFHMQDILRTAGIDDPVRPAALANQAWAIAFGVCTLPAGWIADKVRPQRMLPVAPVLLSLGVLVVIAGVELSAGLSAERTLAVVAAGMAVFGAGMAVGVGVGNPTVARYFGRTHHGSIRGVLSMLMVAGTGAGPFLVGQLYE
ncbi:MAG: MFS transporter, partial [Planctomycetota bacterium]